MRSRDLVINTLLHKPVPRVARDLWTLPYISMFRLDELKAMLERYPSDFAGAPCRPGPSCAEGVPNRRGSYVDEFGCRFEVMQDGVIGEVKEPRIASYEDLNSYELPWDWLNGTDLSEVDAFCKETDKFVLQGTSVRPFERMQFLRGTENLFMDIALEEPGFFELRDRLHEFYLADVDRWCNTSVDGISFMDDWGTQRNLLISPEAWRKLFKPLYKEYCRRIHAAGKFVFFHSDGCIESIYPDLIEIGVDAVNSQLFCMDIEALGKAHAGKITFWGEMDRQNILPFGSMADVEAGVDRVARAMGVYEKRTGVIAQCEWSQMESFENIAALYEAWGKV